MHIITPTAAVLLLVAALVLDWSAAGDDSVRDRAAFVLALCGIYSLWGTSSASATAVQMAVSLVGAILRTIGGRAAEANPADVVTILVSALAVAAVLALKGRIALRTRSDRRINVRVWTFAALLGVLAPAAGGIVGKVLDAVLSILPGLLANALGALVGVLS